MTAVAIANTMKLGALCAEPGGAKRGEGMKHEQHQEDEAVNEDQDEAVGYVRGSVHHDGGADSAGRFKASVELLRHDASSVL